MGGDKSMSKRVREKSGRLPGRRSLAQTNRREQPTLARKQLRCACSLVVLCCVYCPDRRCCAGRGCKSKVRSSFSSKRMD